MDEGLMDEMIDYLCKDIIMDYTVIKKDSRICETCNDEYPRQCGENINSNGQIFISAARRFHPNSRK